MIGSAWPVGAPAPHQKMPWLIWLQTCLSEFPTEGGQRPVLPATTIVNESTRDETMNIGWHPDEDATPTPREVENMAAVLEGRHGRHAAEVADFFSIHHGQSGDAGRSWAWAGVAELVRQRERQRIERV